MEARIKGALAQGGARAGEGWRTSILAYGSMAWSGSSILKSGDMMTARSWCSETVLSSLSMNPWETFSGGVNSTWGWDPNGHRYHNQTRRCAANKGSVSYGRSCLRVTAVCGA